MRTLQLLPRQGGGMTLAARRQIGHGLPGGGRTPLLVPSFSSMADVGWLVEDAVEQLRSTIVETALVSLFDVGTSRLAPPDFPAILFVDSGGYEMHRMVRAVDELNADPAEVTSWDRDAYRAAIGRLSTDVPTIVVSYDHPADRRPIERQIEDASPVLANGMVGELLLKAPPGAPAPSGKVEIAFEHLEPHLDDLARFPIIGVTDKEIGRTLDRRLVFIGRLRRALERRGHQTPIHVFGGLDPVTAPLYFVAGADVFDGLSWQRFALSEAGATYMHSHIAASGMFASSFEAAQLNVWLTNMNELGQLQERMRAFLSDRDFGVFGAHAEMLSRKSRWIQEEVGV